MEVMGRIAADDLSRFVEPSHMRVGGGQQVCRRLVEAPGEEAGFANYV
jgi:hypothetical protein